MISKVFELKNNLGKNIYLFHGQNDGHKETILNNYFKNRFKENIYTYFEKDIFSNLDVFYNSIYSKSFFDDEKLIIIKEATDKIKIEIENIIEKKIDNVTIILLSNPLEKKSKLRNFFEKERDLVSVAFYLDNNQTLASLVSSSFRKIKVPISSELINIIINKSNGDRKMLLNELDKIEMYLLNKKKITFEELNKLLNTGENNEIGELVDNCLAKNFSKIKHLINDNNFSNDDVMPILRTFLFKTKRLLNLVRHHETEKNLEKIVSASKPPIFWKEKDLVKKQIENWSSSQVGKLINEINNVELNVKKNTSASINILFDFIFSNSRKINN